MDINQAKHYYLSDTEINSKDCLKDFYIRLHIYTHTRTSLHSCIYTHAFHVLLLDVILYMNIQYGLHYSLIYSFIGLFIHSSWSFSSTYGPCFNTQKQLFQYSHKLYAFHFIHDKRDPYRSSEGFPISHSYCKSQDFNWSLLALNQVIFFVIPLKICWFVVPSVNIT